MTKYTILAFGAFLFLASCGTPDQESKTVKIPELISDVELRRQRLAEIDSLEKIVFTESATYDTEAMLQLRDKYDHFAKRFDGDEERSPEFLYKSAALSRNIGEPMAAIRSYETFLQKFKGNMRAPEVQFLIAFVYDEDMREVALAKEAYAEVIRKFEGDHWAIQANQRLATIDMSDEELIRYFIEQGGK